MDSEEFDRLHADLVNALARATEILVSGGEQFWSARLAQWEARIVEGDRNALMSLRGSFGGMGSLNEAGVQPGHGTIRTASDARRANQLLHETLGRAYDNTVALLRELDRF